VAGAGALKKRGVSSSTACMKKPRISRRRLLAAALLCPPFAVAADAFWWEPSWVKVRRLKVAKGNPHHRFVHLSDIHHKGDRQYLEGVVRKVNAASPEFVCFTGDLVEEKEFLPEALEIIRQIEAPVFGVPGNHDYSSGSDFKVIEEAFAATGGGWLVEQQRPAAGGAVHITGTACHSALQLKPRPETQNILLMHYPAAVDNLGGTAFDLALAGHSHGGQVRLPFLGALALPGRVGRYELGYYDDAPVPMNVTSGIGWFYLAIRFNCRPEITVIEI
jgi:uncharacterized protein